MITYKYIHMLLNIIVGKQAVLPTYFSFLIIYDLS